MNPAIIGLIVGALLGKKRSEDINFGNNSRFQNNGGSRDGDNSPGNSRGNGEDGLTGSSRSGQGTSLSLRGDMGLEPFNRGSSDVVEDTIADIADNLVSAGKTTGANKGYFDYKPNADPLNPSNWMDALSSYLAGQSGYDLTNAQKGEMAFNHDEAVLQRQWETDMSNTAFQRQVKDMEKAGINPAIAVGGNGASTPSGASASGTGIGVGGDLIGRILEFALGKSQLKMQEMLALRSNASAEHIAEINAGANIRAAEIAANASMYGSDKSAKGKEDENAIRERELQQRKEEFDKHFELLSEQWDKQRQLIDEDIKLRRAQAKTEEAREKLTIADAALKRVSVYQIRELTPVMKNLYIAQEGSNKADAEWKTAQKVLQDKLYSDEELARIARMHGIDEDVAILKMQILEHDNPQALIHETKAQKRLRGYVKTIGEMTTDLTGLSNIRLVGE